MIEKAIEKLEKEAKNASGRNVPAVGIYNFLKDLCLNDEEFTKQMLIPTKSISKCFSYVQGKAYEMAIEQRKELGNKDNVESVGMGDNEIYDLAKEYYMLDDAEIERKKEEERKAREEKQKQEDEKRKTEQAKRDAEKRAKKKDEAKIKKKSEEADNGQISLMDNIGE